VFAYAGAYRPRRLPRAALQRTGLARLGAIAAKSALAFAKINGRIARVAPHQDLGRATFNALAAAGTSAQKIVFCQRPGRTQQPWAFREAATKKIASASEISHEGEGNAGRVPGKK
jgi:hypothetical protein